MSSGYALHLEAYADLDDIRYYIAQENPNAADRVMSEIFDTLRGLVPFPHRGHRRPDLTSRPLRFILVREYLIAYAPEAGIRCQVSGSRCQGRKSGFGVGGLGIRGLSATCRVSGGPRKALHEAACWLLFAVYRLRSAAYCLLLTAYCLKQVSSVGFQVSGAQGTGYTEEKLAGAATSDE
jgi:plasmid stabilization system protein ParE